MLHRKMKETAPTKKLNDINSCNYKKKEIGSFHIINIFN